ncbi:PREDICTED: embryonal Fyn-associated substrate isoform X3 [Mandrillus leucophaeus]|uniref:Embryonal Fyn-associated substrate n=2 Tax=Cercopithecinae TaxID=9528 RepID=A0A2K5Z5I3_MANLE|nr:PREDICTED: embryonal Fyn-associated substrate isoform X3 [Mandrillus leucophaeus]XP_025248622.1 embryonal Fyn-associated substrate isoform X3 [Theropithecus gelada]
MAIATSVYVVPPPARPCPTSGPPAGPCPPSPDPIYKIPRASGTQLAAPRDVLEVYDVPPTALRVLSSSPYDCPASFSHPLTRVALQPPEEDDAPPSPEPPGALASHDQDTLAQLLARSPPPPHRPRLPSAESLSRRPLPALPVPEAPSPSPVPSPAPGRKGSIQDRPLPPPPPRLPGYGGPKVEGDPEGREMEDDPAGHHNEYEGIPMAEEYDYVHLKGMDKAQGSRPPDQACTRDPELPERGMPALQEALSPGEPLVLSTGDLQLLHFYAGQCQSHYSALQVAVAALMSSTQANQPPRLFVPHSKRVVVAAHRLVFVGDTLGRLAASAPLRAQVRTGGTALGQALRATVLAVKGAALGYPSSPAVQEMMQCVTELAGQALRFTTLLTSLAP